MRYRTLFSIVVACALPSAIVAQSAPLIGGIDKLINQIESINIYLGHNVMPAPADRVDGKGRVAWTHDYGVEFGFHVADVGSIPIYSKRLFTREPETKRSDTLKLVQLVVHRRYERETKPG